MPLFGFGTKSSLPSIPIIAAEYSCSINHLSSTTTYKQTYRNETSSPIETRFVFDIGINNVVHSFKAFIVEENKTIEGEIQQKQKAIEKYDNAISSNKGAFLAETFSKSSFSISCGSILPNTTVIVTISFVSELTMEGKSLVHKIPGSLIPSLRRNLEYSYEISVPSKIESIELEPFKNPKIEWENNIGRISGSVNFGELSQDNVLLNLSICDINKPQLVIEHNKEQKTAALQLSLFPLLVDLDVQKEFVFLLDRSGSMGGSRIQQAKDTLDLFLRSLPPKSRFNIIGFGSTYKKMFETSEIYSDSSLTNACQILANWSADLGGTDLWFVFSPIFSDVKVLTDGEVSNPSDVINVVTKQPGLARVFTIGIGSGADRKLVEELAEAGNGKSEIVVNNDRLQTKVMRLLKSALAPNIEDLSSFEKWSKFQSPGKFLKDLVAVEKLLIYSVFSDEILSELPSNEKFNYEVSLNVPVHKGENVHVLAANSRIKELELLKNEETKKEILELALKYKLASSETSFIAVENRNVAMEQTPVLVEIKFDQPPTAVPTTKTNTSTSTTSITSSSGVMRLFGKKKAAPVSNTMPKLRETIDMLEKREEYLNKKIHQELESAKKLVDVNQKAAVLSLKRKQQYEKQAEKIAGARITIEQQLMSLESANVNLESLNAMKLGTGALKPLVSVNNVDDTLDEINEQMSLSDEISNSMSQSLPSDEDEDELLQELENLREESLEERLSDLSAPSASVPRASVSRAPVNAISEDDELRALEEMMGSSSSSIPAKEPQKPTQVKEPPKPTQEPPKTVATPSLDIKFKEDESAFNKIVSLQNASGYWKLSDQLETLGIKLEQVKSLDFENSLTDEQAKATLVVLALLELHFSRFKEDFEIIKLKAMKWLKENFTKVEEMLECAKKNLPSILRK